MNRWLIVKRLKKTNNLTLALGHADQTNQHLQFSMLGPDISALAFDQWNFFRVSRVAWQNPSDLNHFHIWRWHDTTASWGSCCFRPASIFFDQIWWLWRTKVRHDNHFTFAFSSAKAYDILGSKPWLQLAGQTTLTASTGARATLPSLLIGRWQQRIEGLL